MNKLKYKKFNLLPEFGTNTYAVWDSESKEAVLIDVAYPDRTIIEFIRENDLVIRYLINTHGHGDHIAGNVMITEEFRVPLLIHEKDEEMLLAPETNLSKFWGQKVISPGADQLLSGGEMLQLGAFKLQIIHTPGHTRGGICIFVDGYLISGDTIFAGSVGRTDLPGGDMDQLLNSIQQKLFKLPDETVILPGHGPESTIGQEKIENPFAGLAARF
jgi:glyoxylase-like metal-dependent hydrolase (beta-lactamase superfamily II)